MSSKYSLTRKPVEAVNFLKDVVSDLKGVRFYRFEGFDFMDISVTAECYLREPYYKGWTQKVRKFYKAVKKYQDEQR